MRRAAAAGALLLLAACWGSPATAPAPTVAPSPTPRSTSGEGGTFRYAITEPHSIIPGEATEPSDLVVVDALFDSLTTYDAELAVVPSAAVAWTSEPDLRTWTFTLREDATFHDGTPVTARHFQRAWERAVSQGAAGYHLQPVVGYDELRSGQATTLRGVTALGPVDAARTLRVRLREPFADFPAVVAHPSLGPLPDAGLGGETDSFGEQPIGNGPFQASEPWSHGRFIRVIRFEGWRNGHAPAPLAEVVFQLTDPDTGYLAFQQGRLDFTTLPAGALDDAVQRYGRAVGRNQGSGVLAGDLAVVYYLGVHHEQPPFGDPAVRRALSLAIDRLSLAQSSRDANLVPARSLTSVLPGSVSDSCDACRHDVEAARPVFAERGISQLELWFNLGGGHEVIAEAIRTSLEDPGNGVGVALAFQTAETDEYIERLRDGGAGLFRFGWTPDYPTLDAMLYPLLHSRSVPDVSETGANFGRYRSERVDELLQSARATADIQARLALYQEAERVAVGEDQAVIPLFFYRQRAVVSERVEGFLLSPLGLPNLQEVRVHPAP